MVISRSSFPLTKVEKEYLEGTRQFTKAQQRYIRCRLRKKLRVLNEESCNVAAALSERSNAAATIDLRNNNKSSAGSGRLVPLSPSQREGATDISNPRVLSDMGLAIPRPTRLPPVLTSAGLGDPRSSSTVLENIISFANPMSERTRGFPNVATAIAAAASRRLNLYCRHLQTISNTE